MPAGLRLILRVRRPEDRPRQPRHAQTSIRCVPALRHIRGVRRSTSASTAIHQPRQHSRSVANPRQRSELVTLPSAMTAAVAAVFGLSFNLSMVSRKPRPRRRLQRQRGTIDAIHIDRL
jgi:hypothetical protein